MTGKLTTGAVLLAGGVIAAAVGLVATPASAAGNTLVVGNAGATNCPNAMYSTIQSAVDTASSGDTIQVCPGTYPESVSISTPDLTLLGAQSGVDARARTASNASIVTSYNGPFTLTASADGTTINGFVLQGGASGNGVSAFQGSSGLTLVDNVIKLSLNGINLQNPDGSQPALIQNNLFQNNNAGGVSNSQSGTGVFISNGPADNTSINANAFQLDSETAINFAGDASNPSTGLAVTGNKSTNDSTFVVATNSTGAVIQDNTVTTSASAPGGHGTGILDFGANTALKIANNTITATGTTTSSGVSVSNYAPNSLYTDVLNNSINGYYNDIKVVSGNTTAYVSGNKVGKAQNDGIIVQPNVSGVTVTHNMIATVTAYSCEDQTTGNRTAGTANNYSRNTHSSTSKPSSPAGIC